MKNSNERIYDIVQCLTVVQIAELMKIAKLELKRGTKVELVNRCQIFLNSVDENDEKFKFFVKKVNEFSKDLKAKAKPSLSKQIGIEIY